MCRCTTVLGMEVWQSTDGIFLGQAKYAVEILKRFGMMDCKAMATPMALNLKLLSDASSESVDAMMYRQMIGSLMYLTNMRLDIFFAVNTLSQYLTDPRSVHLTVAKHILRYLKGTIDYGLKYNVNQKINLEGYVDLDWAGSAIDRKSTSRCCFSMGLGVISWFSRNKSCVALSTVEVECVTACSASYEAVWLRKLQSDLFDLQLDATCIYCDNQSCVKLLEKLVFHDKSKHIEMKFHYMRNMGKRG